MFTDRRKLEAPLMRTYQCDKKDSSSAHSDHSIFEIELIQQKKYDSLSETKKSDQFRFLTFNLPCFPTTFASCNKDHLPEDGMTRAIEFVRKIKQLKKEDQFTVICLQEIWCKRVADYIQRELKEDFPHQLLGVNSENKLFVKGGLMLLSSQPILDSKSIIFPNSNNMPGSETVGGKGGIAAKIYDGKEGFHTVITTHLHSGDALWKKASTWFGGTTSYRRSVEMGIIHDETYTWAKQPPAKYKNLKSGHTILMGDMNTSVDCKVLDEKESLVDDHKLLGISIGTALNGFEACQIKYPRQRDLLIHYQPPVPTNYLNPRLDRPFKRGKGKPVNGAFIAEAVKKDFFTGTVSDGHLSHQYPTHLIDLMAIRKDGPEMGEFTTQIVSFDNERFAVSDHFAVAGCLDMTKRFIHRKGIYEDLEPVIVKDAVNPSVGFVNRLFKRHTELYEVKLPDHHKKSCLTY